EVVDALGPGTRIVLADPFPHHWQVAGTIPRQPDDTMHSDLRTILVSWEVVGDAHGALLADSARHDELRLIPLRRRESVHEKDERESACFFEVRQTMSRVERALPPITWHQLTLGHRSQRTVDGAEPCR